MPVKNRTKQNTTPRRSLSLMLKSASGRCNMNCSYCFYKAETKGRELPDRGILSETDGELLIRRLSEYFRPGDVLDIGFQGGEPSLLPASFYEAFAEKLENSCPAEVHWYFQTNGLLIDQEFCAFFRKHKVLVGLSLDMEESFHDLNRKDHSGMGTWKQVVKTKKLLDREGIDYNILSVLTPAMAKHPDRVWNFIRREDLRYVQFLPAFRISQQKLTVTENEDTAESPSDGILDRERRSLPSENEQGGHSFDQEGRSLPSEIDRRGTSLPVENTFLTPELYADFYERLAELWLDALKKGEYYSIKLLDDLVHLLRGDGIHACGLCGTCEPQLILEADLSAYPCDFYCTDEFLLGNLREQDIQILLEAGLPFRNRKRTLPPVCAACPFRDLCSGGCPVLFPFTCVSSGYPAADCAAAAAADAEFCGYRKFLFVTLPEIKKSGLF